MKHEHTRAHIDNSVFLYTTSQQFKLYFFGPGPPIPLSEDSAPDQPIKRQLMSKPGEQERLDTDFFSGLLVCSLKNTKKQTLSRHGAQDIATADFRQMMQQAVCNLYLHSYFCSHSRFYGYDSADTSCMMIFCHPHTQERNSLYTKASSQVIENMWFTEMPLQTLFCW